MDDELVLGKPFCVFYSMFSLLTHPEVKLLLFCFLGFRGGFGCLGNL